jgi:hypothetical protein
MLKIKTLDDLCVALTKDYENPPTVSEWQFNIQIFREIYPNTKIGLNLAMYTCFFSEIDLTRRISKLSQEFNVNMNPLQEETKINGGEHILRYNSPLGRVSVEGSDGKEITDYDQFVLIGNNPVVFEIKLRAWHGRGKINPLCGSSGGLIHAFRPEIFNPKLEPIKKLMNSDVGYVIIIPRDIFISRERKPRCGSEEALKSYYRNFKEIGGKVVPFYVDKDRFREEVFSVVKEYHLKLDIPFRTETKS